MPPSAIPPKVSVIVLTYRQENYIDAALASILAQEGPPVEIIVGDDASPDGTAARIRRIIDAYQGPHSVRLLAHPRNLGLLGNFNRCVSASTGDIIVAAAGDDISHPGRVLRMAGAFEEHPEIDLVICNGRRIDDAGRPFGGPIFPDRPDREAFDPLAKLNLLYQRLPLLGALYAYRRHVFTDFEPLLPGSHGEDNALGFRALLRGGYLYLPEVLVDYRVHAASMSFDLLTADESRPAALRRLLRALRLARGLRLQHLADLRRAREAGLVGQADLRLLRRRVEFYFFEHRLRLHAHAARLTPLDFAALACALLRIAPARALSRCKNLGRRYARTRFTGQPGYLRPGAR